MTVLGELCGVVLPYESRGLIISCIYISIYLCICLISTCWVFPKGQCPKEYNLWNIHQVDIYSSTIWNFDEVHLQIIPAYICNV